MLVRYADCFTWCDKLWIMSQRCQIRANFRHLFSDPELRRSLSVSNSAGWCWTLSSLKVATLRADVFKWRLDLASRAYYFAIWSQRFRDLRHRPGLLNLCHQVISHCLESFDFFLETADKVLHAFASDANFLSRFFLNCSFINNFLWMIRPFTLFVSKLGCNVVNLFQNTLLADVITLRNDWLCVSVEMILLCFII